MSLRLKVSNIFWCHSTSIQPLNLGTLQHVSTDYTRADFRKCARFSLSLTLVNIFMIWVSSMLMFRMKEVLPIQKKVFWSDLGIARKIYRGKAVLAHQAFDPTASSLAQPGRINEHESSDWKKCWMFWCGKLREMNKWGFVETGSSMYSEHLFSGRIILIL